MRSEIRLNCLEHPHVIGGQRISYRVKVGCLEKIVTVVAYFSTGKDYMMLTPTTEDGDRGKKHIDGCKVPVAEIAIASDNRRKYGF